MARPHQATARSSAARSSGAHAARSKPCTAPSPLFCSTRRERSTRAQELTEARRVPIAYPPSKRPPSRPSPGLWFDNCHHSIPYHQMTRNRAIHHSSNPARHPCGHSIFGSDYVPIRPLAGIRQETDEADTSGQSQSAVSTAHTAEQSNFPGSGLFGSHPGFGFWLFKVGFAFDFDCRPPSTRGPWQQASLLSGCDDAIINCPSSLPSTTTRTRRGSSEHYPI